MPRIKDLFEIQRGQGLDLNTLTEASSRDAVNYVSNSSRNNGVSARVLPVSGIEPSPAGSITISLAGSALETFLQPAPFYSSQNISILTPKQPMTDHEKLWWVLCIRANIFRFSFGRKANITHSDLELPDEIPDWATDLRIPNLDLMAAARLVKVVVLPDIANWRAFRYADLFDIMRGEFTPTAEIMPGDVPLVRSSERNNGVTDFVDLPTRIHPAGTISVARNGSVGEAFYQDKPYHASDDVHVFYPKQPVTADQALFLCTLIRAEKYRYNYGRKWSVERMRESTMRLPVDGDGEPDWALVGCFMASLPFSIVVKE